MATYEECEVASNAAGRDVSASEIDAALATHGVKSLDELEQEFAILFVGFEHSRGRDAELADTLDSMHLAIEVRRLREANG